MSRWSRRLRAGAGAGVAAAAVTLAAVVPGGGAAAAPHTGAVPHANLRSALQRLPNYFPGIVHWKLSASTKHYGTTNWDTNTITISAFTPLNLLYSVIAHEWSHEIQAFVYRRQFWRVVTVMNKHFGGPGTSGQRGVEYAADCMAILQGATWTDYTSCHDPKWRHEAKRLLHGHPLKARHRVHHKPAHHKPAGTAPAAYPVAAGPATSEKQKPAKPTPAPTDYPQPQRYPAPPAYTIPWTGWF